MIQFNREKFIEWCETNYPNIVHPENHEWAKWCDGREIKIEAGHHRIYDAENSVFWYDSRKEWEVEC